MAIEAANYSAVEELRNGRRVEIRALRPDDRADLLAAVGRTGAESLFRRFFATKRGLTQKEIEFFLDIDFIAHVALVAVVEEEGRSMLVGGGVTSSSSLGRLRSLSLSLISTKGRVSVRC